MATLPNLQQTAEAIYKWYEDRRVRIPPREYLGGSEIGEECRRKLWYRFRHVRKPTFPGRILRLFETGDYEENRIVHNLRAIGCIVHSVDENTGRQFEYVACNGHFKTHLDGVVLGLLEAPKTWHLLECKSSNNKQFVHLEKNGVEKSKPVHFAQMQVMMGLAQLKRAFYFVVNKDTDAFYTERVKYSATVFKALMQKAQFIIDATKPPERLSEKPDYFQCKWCDLSEICHGRAIPDVNCRTCAHSTPVDNGRWQCARGFECKTCDEHIFLPPLLHWAEPIDGDDTWVKYKVDGDEFVNCAATGFAATDCKSYSSNELRA